MTQMLTTEEIAERYRTSPSTVRYWRMEGQGPRGVRIGKRVLYDLRDVEAFEKECREKEKASA